jgi:hypothetical protein
LTAAPNTPGSGTAGATTDSENQCRSTCAFSCRATPKQTEVLTSRPASQFIQLTGEQDERRTENRAGHPASHKNLDDTQDDSDQTLAAQSDYLTAQPRSYQGSVVRFATTYKTTGTAKIPEVVQDIAVCARPVNTKRISRYLSGETSQNFWGVKRHLSGKRPIRYVPVGLWMETPSEGQPGSPSQHLKRQKQGTESHGAVSMRDG